MLVQTMPTLLRWVAFMLIIWSLPAESRYSANQLLEHMWLQAQGQLSRLQERLIQQEVKIAELQVRLQATRLAAAESTATHCETVRRMTQELHEHEQSCIRQMQVRGVSMRLQGNDLGNALSL